MAVALEHRRLFAFALYFQRVLSLSTIELAVPDAPSGEMEGIRDQSITPPACSAASLFAPSPH
jgi:hypothetical protein